MTARDYGGLRLRLAATILLFSLGPLLSAGAFFYYRVSRTHTASLTAKLATMVDNKKAAMDLYLGQKIAMLQTLAQTHTLTQLSREAELGLVFRAMQQASRDFVDLGVIDSTGRHLAYAGPYDLKDVNYSHEPWFQEVTLNGVYVSDVFTGFRKFPHIIIAVQTNDGDRGWILRATINQDLFDAQVQRLQMGQKGDAYLVNRQGILQSSSRFWGPPLRKVPLDTRDLEPFHGVRVAARQPDGSPRLLGMMWLERPAWLLVVSVDPEEDLAELVGTQSQVLMITLAGGLIILAGAWWVVRLAVGRLEKSDREAAALDAQLTHSAKMAALGKLAAGVAHEINNPLSLIREGAGWIQDLLEEEEPASMKNHAEIVARLAKIDQHVERARNVTHRMLGFGRRLDSLRREVDLGALALDTWKFLENEARHRQIQFQTQLQPDLPLTATDPDLLQQALLNLLDNAIDAAPTGGHITLITRRQGATALLLVTDDGPGIPAEVRAKIFDPFYTTKSPGQGTGLGLSIVYGIMQKLGGSITVECPPEGGTVFTLSLPLAPEEAA